MTTSPKQLPRRPARRSGRPDDPLEQLLRVAVDQAEADADVLTWLSAMRDHGALAASAPMPGGPRKPAA
jgi:hypothetical protein